MCIPQGGFLMKPFMKAMGMDAKEPAAPQAPVAPPASQAAQAPDESMRRKKTPGMGALTELTGPNGIDSSGLTLGKNSLLGL